MSEVSHGASPALLYKRRFRFGYFGIPLAAVSIVLLSKVGGEPLITSVNYAPNDTFVIRFIGSTSFVYQIESVPALGRPTLWLPVTNFVGYDTSMVWVQGGLGLVTNRFYRIGEFPFTCGNLESQSCPSLYPGISFRQCEYCDVDCPPYFLKFVGDTGSWPTQILANVGNCVWMSTGAVNSVIIASRLRCVSNGTCEALPYYRISILDGCGYTGFEFPMPTGTCDQTVSTNWQGVNFTLAPCPEDPCSECLTNRYIVVFSGAGGGGICIAGFTNNLSCLNGIREATSGALCEWGIGGPCDTLFGLTMLLDFDGCKWRVYVSADGMNAAWDGPKNPCDPTGDYMLNPSSVVDACETNNPPAFPRVRVDKYYADPPLKF